jgi:hypothetical protein
MDHLPSSSIDADQHFQDAPFADERARYLCHCAAHGARPAALRIKRNELLWIARHLGSNANQGVGMTELMPIAQQRQNRHGATTAARRVIDIGRPWLRFLGWWREPVVLFSYQSQLDRYLAWMRDERGFTPSTVAQWGRITEEILALVRTSEENPREPEARGLRQLFCNPGNRALGTHLDGEHGLSPARIFALRSPRGLVLGPFGRIDLSATALSARVSAVRPGLVRRPANVSRYRHGQAKGYP